MQDICVVFKIIKKLILNYHVWSLGKFIVIIIIFTTLSSVCT